MGIASNSDRPSDVQAIMKVVSTLAQAQDDRDFGRYRSCLTDEIFVEEYPGEENLDAKNGTSRGMGPRRAGGAFELRGHPAPSLQPYHRGRGGRRFVRSRRHRCAHAASGICANQWLHVGRPVLAKASAGGGTVANLGRALSSIVSGRAIYRVVIARGSGPRDNVGSRLDWQGNNSIDETAGRL